MTGPRTSSFGMARADRLGDQVAEHIGGYARARANRALVTECHPALGTIPRKSPITSLSSWAGSAAG